VRCFQRAVGTCSSIRRLKVIFESNDGFEIARADLQIRGPGEFLGARQSGVKMLRFADLERGVALIKVSRDAAENRLAREPVAAAAHVEHWRGGKAEFFRAQKEASVEADESDLPPGPMLVTSAPLMWAFGHERDRERAGNFPRCSKCQLAWNRSLPGPGCGGSFR